MNTEVITGWHFLPADRRLQFAPHTLVQIGVPLEYYGEPVLCQSGLHASRRVIDALQYAPGPILCRVEVSGVIVEGTGKLAGTRRTVTAWCDATRILHAFACDVATEALDQIAAAGGSVDPRSRAAIETKRRWLRGEASDQDLAAAGTAARAAAGAAAGAAQNERLESLLSAALHTRENP